MPVFNNILAGSSGQGDTGYDIDQSLRFEDSDSASLEKAYASSGNRKTWTWSSWVKRSELGSATPNAIFSSDTGPQVGALEFLATDAFTFYDYSIGSSYQSRLVTTALYRDIASWYHIVVAYDTTQATASNRIKIYINGSQVTDFSTETYPSQDFDGYINYGNNSRLHGVGKNTGLGDFLEGYLAEVHFIDGTALDASSFGETNSATNQWIPVEYTGSYGTNGFYLKFQDSSALGDDSSGNTNDFTVNNLVATDQMIDTPTNNYCTLNPLLEATIDRFTLSEGNLKITANGADWNACKGTMEIPSSGKWYFETYCATNTNAYSGIVEESEDLTVTNPSGGVVYYYGDGRKRIDGTFSSYGAAVSVGDIIGVAVDMDASPRTITFYKNNATQGTITITGSCATETVFPYVTSLTTNYFNFGQDSSFAGTKTAQGNGGDGEDFYYTPPTGYKALNTSNLPDPAIADPTKHFNTVLYSGNGSSQTISSLNFAPDFTWIKSRSNSSSNALFDTVRGATKELISNDSAAEQTFSDSLTAFTSDGFTLGADTSGAHVNVNSQTYASWNWLAGGTAVSNTDGSITSSVSANTTAGFSVVTWTNHNVTVGHGLSQAPELIIIKDRSATTSWLVYSEPVGNGHTLFLNGTNAQDNGTTYFNSTSPTSSVFSVGTGIGGSTDNYLAYCFHGVDGYSKIGSYTGNNNADGPFIYTGFRPAWVMVKSYSAGGTHYDWPIYDSARSTYNAVGNVLEANQNQAEITGTGRGLPIDFLSNGFKHRSSYGENNSTPSYIYLAFAESPFKYSNAR